MSWWSKDPKDLKSTVTLRHLLSFTSAFGGGVPGQENTTKTCMDSNKTTDYMACAREIYYQTNLSGTPGVDFSYNSIHLQLAGAIAISVTGLDIQGVLKKYLFDAYDMGETSCALPSPQVTWMAARPHRRAVRREPSLLDRASPVGAAAGGLPRDDGPRLPAILAEDAAGRRARATTLPQHTPPRFLYRALHALPVSRVQRVPNLAGALQGADCGE